MSRIETNQMKHLVIGAGNLGIDLFNQLKKNGLNVSTCSRSTGWNIQHLRQRDDFLQYAKTFDVVWYCVGFGSIKEAMEDAYGAHQIHLEIPAQLIAVCPYVVFFSSDYVADERFPKSNDVHASKMRSHYAHLKWRMECAVNQSENATAIRVGSLYGSHKPMSTFPGKLLKNMQEKTLVKLPLNLVTPTSTSWLSEILVQNFDRLYRNPEGQHIHHAAPHGFVTVREWGSMILGQPMNNDDTFFDYERPLLSCLDTSFASHQTHWLQRWSEEWNMSLRERILKSLQS
jgi:dTDP-4-dehydrorhamnose reductase